GYRWLPAGGDDADRKRRRRSFRAAPPCARCRASCRQSKPDRHPGSLNVTRGWCWIGSALPTRTGDSTLAAGAAGAKIFSRVGSSHQLDDVPGGVAAPFLEQVEAFQRGLVARDEQDRRSFLVAVDVLEPGTAGHCDIIEFFPIETLALDD